MPKAREPSYYMARLWSIASARGGKVVSQTYVNDYTKLRFRCAEGHEFEAEPGKLLQGRWCYKCGRTRTGAARRDGGVAKLRSVVAARGGSMELREYTHSQAHMAFRCREGHEWRAVPNSIIQGTWCPECSVRGREDTRKDRVFERIREFVRRRDGKLLSTAFVGSHHPLSVECKRGHVWGAEATSLEAGRWCPECKSLELTEVLQGLAAKAGGRLVSTAARHSRDALEWECALGHRWIARGSGVKRGTWCPRCRQPHLADIGTMHQAARERGGVCLSTEYVNSATKLRWRCREGHEWEAPLTSITNGTWCRICKRGFGRSRAHLNLETMHEMARERGGACLSGEYRGIYDRLRWRCARGHEWVSVANNVRRGCWCPTCSHSTRGTLEGLQWLALELGGRCLTTAWNDRRQPLRFECQQGHRFELHANVAKTGVWCSVCAHASHGPAASGEPVHQH